MADLLQAIKDRDLAKTRALLEVDGVNAAYEFYEEGGWGACERTSPIHEALFNWRNEWYQVKQEKSPEEVAKHHFEWRDIVLTLIRKGAQVNAKHESFDWRGCGSAETAFELILDLAMATSDHELLALALQSGGDPNAESVSNTHSMRTDGKTVSYPIHTAAARLSYECLKTLIEAKANVNVQFVSEYHNERGFNSNTVETALHSAIGADSQNRNIDKLRVVRLLLESGADVNAERKELVQEHVEVNSPTDDPRAKGFIPSVRCIPRRETPLLMALRLGLAEVVRMLVIYGADTSAKLRYGMDSPRSVWDLAGSDEALLSALHCKWEPRYHHFYPPPVRRSIFTALCVAKRQAWPLPSELLHEIFNWAVKSSVIAAPEPALDT